MTTVTARAALLPLLPLLPLLACVGCASTTYGRPNSPAAQAWFARRTSSALEADLAPDGPSDRTPVVIEARSPTDFRIVARDARVISVDRVAKVVDVRHGLGALEGAAMGVAAGALFGVLYGSSRDLTPYERSMDCALVCNHADAAKVSALMFGALGLLVGAGVGAIIGARDVLDLR